MSVSRDELDAAIKVSVSQFVARLQSACGAIQGAAEDDASVYGAMQHAESMLVRVLCDPSSTQRTVQEECAKLARAHTSTACALHREALAESCSVINVLLQAAQLQSSVAYAEKVCAMMQAPPRAFEEHLATHHVDQSALRAGCRDAAWKQYIRSGSNARRLSLACRGALAELCEAMQLPNSSWHRLCASTSDGLRPDLDVDVKSPAHAQGARLVLSCTEGRSCCLGVVRFVKALELCAAHGVIVVGCADRAFLEKYGRKVSKWQAPAADLVPVALERDFHILCVVESHIPQSSGQLSASEAAKKGLKTSSFLRNNFGVRSVEQSLNYVIKRCAAATGVDYVRSETGRTTGRLEMSEADCARLRVYVRSTLAGISQGGEIARKTWRPSRSSKTAAAVRRQTVQ